MINFDFVSPTKIYFGKDREKEIGLILKSAGINKVLFHYGKNSIKKTGLYDMIISSFNKHNIEYYELGGVEPNPKISLVRQGVEIVKSNKIPFILAVGGGSVIDSAKGIAVSAFSGIDIWDYSTQKETVKGALPLGVILTISAAGSELSNSCVLSNPELNLKRGFNSDLIRPKFAVMNPELTYSVGKFQTGCGIVDIMMHTMERYLTDTTGIALPQNLGAGLIKSVMQKAKIAIDEPNNYDARATLMLASSFSHNGLTGLGAKMYFTVHKLEHELSGMYDNVAHGAGLSVLFPAWAKYVYQDFPELFAKFAVEVLEVEKNKKTTLEVAFEGITKLQSFFKEIGMPTTLAELMIESDNFEAMANNATCNNTKKVLGIKDLDVNDIINIFNLAR